MEGNMIKLDNINMDTLMNNKTPMSLINELARFNKINHKYTLVNEVGPGHDKLYTVTLELGNESYSGQGKKIKKAQQDAAATAIRQTRYKHPTVNIRAKQTRSNVSPTVQLNMLVMKKRIPVEYRLVNIPAFPVQRSNYSYNYLYECNNIPCYGISCGLRGQCALSSPLPVYDYDFANNRAMSNRTQLVTSVQLTVNGKSYVGIGKNEKQARQDAAVKALVDIKSLSCSDVDGLSSNNGTSQQVISKNAVSIVYERGQQLKMKVSFNKVNCCGPIHLMTYETECTFGDMFRTIGKSIGKQESKRIAAEEMVKILDSNGLLYPNEKLKKKGNKRIRLKENRLKTDVGENENDNDNEIKKSNVFIELKKTVREIYKDELVLPTYRSFAKVTKKGQDVIITKLTVKDHMCVCYGKKKFHSRYRAAFEMLKKLKNVVLEKNGADIQSSCGNNGNNNSQCPDSGSLVLRAEEISKKTVDNDERKEEILDCKSNSGENNEPIASLLERFERELKFDVNYSKCKKVNKDVTF